MSTQGQALINENKYSALGKHYIYFYPEWDINEAYNDAFHDWLWEQDFAWLYLGDFYYKVEYRNALQFYRNGPGKTEGDKLGVEVGIQIYPIDENKALYNEFQDRFWDGMEAWATSQNLITENEARNIMHDTGFEDQWLTNAFGKNAPYYDQFYSKTALRIVSGRLEIGSYFIEVEDTTPIPTAEEALTENEDILVPGKAPGSMSHPNPGNGNWYTRAEWVDYEVWFWIVQNGEEWIIYQYNDYNDSWQYHMQSQERYNRMIWCFKDYAEVQELTEIDWMDQGFIR